AGQLERPFDRTPGSPARAWPCPEDLARITDRLCAARRPVLIGGHGIWWSGAERGLENAGRRLGIPVFNIPYHQKLLGEESESYMGLADIHQYPPSKFAIGESDVALVVGGRLDNQMNFGNPPLFPESTRLICVNGSAEELELNRAADETLLCDPGVFLDALCELEGSDAWNLGREWIEENRTRRRQWVQEMETDLVQSDDGKTGIHPLQLALATQNPLGSDDWLVIDGGNTHFWSEIAINMAGAKGQQLKGILHPGAFSMLGVGVSFALAAKLRHPDSQVLLISG
ncbi:uncharacterized protein METZ01_LOCUS397494, partial [marine metagenome]